MIGGDYFYREAVKRGTEVELHREEDAIPAMVNEKNEDMINEAATWYEEQNFEKRTITTYDDLILEADFLKNEESTGKAVILAHGFRSQRADMSDFVQFYHEQGFDILIPDSRGHGESEGDYIGFGWHDRLDYQKWIKELIDEENSSDIFLHGVSMGAGTVLMTSGEDLPNEVKGVIADSGYTSAEDILTYQLQQIYQLPAFPIIQITSGLTNVRAGFSFGEASAVAQAAKNTRPLFIIHGEADELVPTAMADEIYEAAGGDKTLWTVPGAGHVKSYTVETVEYQDRLMKFFEESMKNN
ncbi:alpha/beta hydrolase [Salipaludibacillus neizhouensis]|uniref:Alpha/beta hydrolase n=2 Tax=Salipaludibacillus neizhouensis TaxID=885475 RepID=A0A3A9K8F9_9BACI|nr:alpha/beta hydrolase [Salipaludibacillus neizhouensis]